MGKTILVVLIVLTVIGVSSIAYARYKGFCKGPEGRAEWIIGRVSRQLDLDDHQQQMLRQLKDKVLVFAQQMRGEAPEYKAKAIALLDAPILDRQQANRLWEEKMNRVGGAGPELIAAFADFSDSLNEAQRGKLGEMMSRHHGPHRFGGPCCGAPRPASQE